MKKPIKEANDNESESLIKLIQVMRDDSLINKRVIEMLKLNSYQRRAVLNNWLERLREQRQQRRKLQGTAKLQLGEAERSGRLVAEAEAVSYTYDSHGRMHLRYRPGIT